MIDDLNLWNRLTPHFSLTEFCRSTSFPYLSISLRNVSEVVRERIRLLCEFVLEPLRRHLDDLPIIIHSGLRSPELNRAVDGSLTSDHLFRGNSGAVDFHVKNIFTLRVVNAIANLNPSFAYLIAYLNFPNNEGEFIHFSMPHGIKNTGTVLYRHLKQRDLR